MYYKSVTSLAVQVIAVALIALERDIQHRNVNNARPYQHSYDYIVVGAGAGGCVVARRLSDTGATVLLLEAGPVQTFITDVPGLERSLLRDNPQYNWAYSISPQRKIGLGRAIPGVYVEDKGRALGGTTTINRMVYVRPNPRDMDAWAHRYGADGWSWNEVLPYFIKSENNTDYNIVAQSPGLHGTGGPLTLTSVDPRDQTILSQLQKAFNEWGAPTIDINGPSQLGTSFVQLTIQDGVRESTANAYVDPNPNPHNLFISTDSYVTRVITDNSGHGGLRAVGVEFDNQKEKYRVMANKEVIMAAGSYGSPHILMLSGIGPKEHLDEMNIKTLVDLPVGYNLQEHVQVSFWSTIREGIRQKVLDELPQSTIEQLYQLTVKNMGPLTASPVVHTFMNTKSNDDPKWPNIIQSGRFIQFTTNLTELIETYDPNRAGEWAQYFKPLLGAPHLLSDIFVRRTRSIGWVRLHSNDPYVLPEINPNFFADKRDFDDLLEAFKFQLFFIANSHISKFVERYPVPVPPCAHLYCKDKPEWECDEYLKCYIIEIGDKEHHSVGTCRMGNPHRKDTVVDPQLRVKGVEGLRVCDASIAPLLPNANTNAMTIMIGEKCADMIKQGDHGASYSNSGYSGGVGNLVSSGASYITSDNSHLLYAKAKAA